MAAVVQQHQPRARHTLRRQPRIDQRHSLVIFAEDNQCGRLHARQPVGDAGAAKPKSESAKSKAKQRANETKVKECYAKTENDDDARALVSAVAKGIIGKPYVRFAMWLAIRNPRIVFLGEEVSRLGRVWHLAVRALIWCAGAGIRRPVP